MLWLSMLLVGSCSAIIVKTKGGSVKGYPFSTRNERDVFVFSGIPYASPPLSHLRFKDPTPPKPWVGLIDRNATPVCLQFLYPLRTELVIGVEDCLYLTIYTPKLNTTDMYPVIVYFHGGAFTTGSGQQSHGAQYIMDYDIVLVQVEYRLGALGFLSMEDNIMAGNMGLKDQVMAIRWVKHNIDLFKGDPNKMTLMGDSAGAASVNFHMISPMSKGLFHRAIGESGVSLAPWAYLLPGAARQSAVQIATNLGCPTTDSDNILICLQSKNVTNIVRQYPRELPVDLTHPTLLFLPIIDKNSSNPFLPKDPHHLKSQPIPWLTGCNNIDGFLISGIFVLLYPDINLYSDFDATFGYYAPLIMFYNSANKSNEISKQIRNFYFGNQSISEASLNNLTNMISDRYFFWPMVESLKLHNGPRYVYNFAYNTEQSFQFDYTEKRVLNGSTHEDETIFLWNDRRKMNLPLVGEDLKLSKRLVKLFTNFVIFGTPTPSESKFDWPIWDDYNQTLLTIGYKGKFIIDRGFYTKRMNFWSTLKQQQLLQNI